MKHLKLYEDFKDYQIHDNGGRPMIVNSYDDWKQVKVYTHNVTVNNVKKVWEGEEGSTVVIEMENGKCAFFGNGESYEFTPEDVLEKYEAKIGNSDVPYPVLIGEKYAYFLLDKVFVDREKLESKVEESKGSHGSDFYGIFFEFGDSLDKNPMKTEKIQDRIIDLDKMVIESRIIEGKSEIATKETILAMTSLPQEIKEEAVKHLKKYSKKFPGGVTGLSLHPDLQNRIKEKGLPDGLDMGMDKDGYYVHTHRARCKSYTTPEKISIKDIKFINSTG